MALSGDAAGTLIANAIEAMSDADKQDIEKIWQTACTQLFAHITASAVITTTTTGTAAVASGSSAGSWPTAGAGTGTVS